MEKQGQIGFGFPVVCSRHPNQVKNISEPGQLPKVAPLGMFDNLVTDTSFTPSHRRLHTPMRIQARLWAHLFVLSEECFPRSSVPSHFSGNSQCHADLDNHKSTLCYMKCVRLACTRQHPCARLCHEPCGGCEFPISNVTLPCGHVKKQVPWYVQKSFFFDNVNINSSNFSRLLEELKSVKCEEMVLKKLPYCEHSKLVQCHRNPSSTTCTELCDQPMDCCSRKCKGKCGECQKQNLSVTSIRLGLIARINHVGHPCERALYCQHLCGRPCHPKDRGCNNECKESCRQRCIHHKCQKPCSATCAPCLEQCPWRCDHHECPVACGSVRRFDSDLLLVLAKFSQICARLPCDEPCTKILGCEHPCPSGELHILPLFCRIAKLNA